MAALSNPTRGVPGPPPRPNFHHAARFYSSARSGSEDGDAERAADDRFGDEEEHGDKKQERRPSRRSACSGRLRPESGVKVTQALAPAHVRKANAGPATKMGRRHLSALFVIQKCPRH